MKFFCYNILFIVFCLVCEVLSDYSESILPSKDDFTNRDHRTMRMNMRVGKRFGGSLYQEDEVINKRELPNPKRQLRLVIRPGKRNHDGQEQTHSYITPHQEETFEGTSIKAPKRTLRMVERIGKRQFNENEQENTLFTPQTQFYTQSHYDDVGTVGNKRTFPSPKRQMRMFLRNGKRNYDGEERTKFHINTHQEEALEESPEETSMKDPKRSPSHFLMNPRVGKNDRHWKQSPLNNIQKRSDPKATDLWFGPRLGRSNDEEFEHWNYIILNGNDMPTLSEAKNPLDDQQSEELTE